MNAPELSLAQIAFSGAFRPAVLPGGSGNEEPRSGRGGSVLVPCVLLSIALHAVLLLGLEFRQIEREADRTLLLDIVAPAVKELAPQVPQASRVVPEPGSVRTRPEPTPPARKAASRPARPRQTEKKEKVGPSQKVAQRPAPEKPQSGVLAGGARCGRATGASCPRRPGRQRPGATVLANESGQDALKHGAEARFMHGVATEEFVRKTMSASTRLAMTVASGSRTTGRAAGTSSFIRGNGTAPETLSLQPLHLRLRGFAGLCLSNPGFSDIFFRRLPHSPVPVAAQFHESILSPQK